MKVIIVFIQQNHNGITTKYVHEIKKPREVFLLSDIQDQCKKEVHLSFVYKTVSFITSDKKDFSIVATYLTV